MPLTERQQQIIESNAGNGFFRDCVDAPSRQTLRQLSLQTEREGTVRQTVGSGTLALWSGDGMPIADQAQAAAIAARHIQAANRLPEHTSYIAAQFDDQVRPLSSLVMPDRLFGSHLRPPTESQDSQARRGDHRGHGVAQAQTMMAPGVHHAIMTSQAPEMNTAVQLPLERQVNTLIGQGRQVFWEVHNEFSEPGEPGTLPRASHQSFVVLSADTAGDDLRLHFNARISQR